LLTILVIRDSRPGHFNQSEGVAKAIQRIAPASVRYLDLKRRGVLSWHLLYLAYNRNIFPDQFFMNLVYPSMSADFRPDLVISAGGETLLLNILLSKRYGCPNIFCGSIRNLDSRFFSAILIPYHRYRGIPPYVYALKPCPVDPDVPPRFGKRCDFCFLIGGPSGTHSYSDAHWTQILGLVREASKRFEITVFTSRRTPSEILAALKTLQDDRLKIFDPTQVQAAELIDYCKRARAIIVTEDSNSMITEAVCCQKPVVTIAPPQNKMNTDESEYIESLIASNWVSRQMLDETFSLDTIISKLEDIKPMTFNHLQILSSELEKIIPIAGHAESGAEISV
jgi:mitochondrial fission protein ELM1